MFYAVAQGRTPGLYQTWEETKAQVCGYQGALYKKFNTIEEANVFLNNLENPFPTQTDHHDHDLVCFTDGSCLSNGSSTAKTGCAVVWPYHPELNQCLNLTGTYNTNNQAELRAVKLALDIADTTLDPTQKEKLHVYTDSKLVINTFESWIHNWKNNGWKNKAGASIANIDLIIEIYNLLKKRKIVFHHVEAHTKKNDWVSVHNALADKLARQAPLCA